MAITFDEVALAAAEIKEAGERPTIERVRLQLGGRGSNSTIVKHLHALKREATATQGFDKPETPNVVQAVVESAWNQLREQADGEITKIREEANAKIALFQQQAAEAVEESNQLKQKHAELQTFHNRVLAEKELLSLDFSKQQMEHRLLEARYAGLDESYKMMQEMANQQLALATAAHKNEMGLLEGKFEALKHANQKLVDEIKEQAESDRHQKMMMIDELKMEYRKQDKKLTDCEAELNHNNIKISALKAELQSISKERDLAMERLSLEEEKWKTLDNKFFVSDDFIAEINKIPSLIKTINHSKEGLTSRFNTLISSFSDEIKKLVNNMEAKHE